MNVENLESTWNERSLDMCRHYIEPSMTAPEGCKAFGLHKAHSHGCNVESCPLVHPELLIIEAYKNKECFDKYKGECRMFEKLDKMPLIRRFHYIAFDCEGRLCSECVWNDKDKNRCIKRNTMREVESRLREHE